MGGQGSGGVRQGAPGVAHSNRTDLNTPKPGPLPVATTRGQTYGVAGAQAQAQAQIPLANPAPRLAVPLDSPTARPTEPVTSGLSTGPGLGPDAIAQRAPDPTSLQLRSIYRLYPNNDLLSLIEFMDSGQKY
jgi:hypothetical protein